MSKQSKSKDTYDVTRLNAAQAAKFMSQFSQVEKKKRKRKRGKGRNNLVGPRFHEDVSFQTVVAPAARSTTTRRRLAPQEKVIPSGRQFTHSEEITTINGSTNLNFAQYTIQPGFASVLPWLAIKAQTMTSYEIIRMKAEYIPACGSSTAGEVFLAFDPNAANSTVPLTESIISSYAGAVSGPLWNNLCCEADCKVRKGRMSEKYIRNGPEYGDTRTYDWGNLFVGVLGNNGNPCGKLWLHYTINMYDESLVQSVNLQAPASDFASFYIPSILTLSSGVATTVGFGVGYSSSAVNWPISGLYAGGTATSFTPGSGIYLVEGAIQASNTANEVFTVLFYVSKNGNAVSIGESVQRVAGNASGSILMAYSSAVVACNTTDSISLTANLTGSTGTLQIAANTAWIRIRPI